MIRPWVLITEHGTRVNRRTFATFEAAALAAMATDPDRDGSMNPNVREALASHPGYSRGFFWFENRYAIVIDSRRVDQ